MKRSILSVLVAAIVFFAVTTTASAHVVTKAEVTCTGITVSWTSFLGGPFDMNVAFQDQANGKDVPSPYVVAHLSGASGSKFIAAPAAAGVTFRKALATWTVDGGGSVSASAVVNCGETPHQPPPPTGTTVTVTTPGKTVTTPGQTVTTPGVTTPGSTTPGQTTTVTRTITTPAVTVTAPPVTLPAVTVTTPGKATPGATRTIIKHKTIIRYRNRPVIVKCGLRGWNGSYSKPPGGKPGPIVARCSQGKQGTLGAGVTG